MTECLFFDITITSCPTVMLRIWGEGAEKGRSVSKVLCHASMSGSPELMSKKNKTKNLPCIIPVLG